MKSVRVICQPGKKPCPTPVKKGDRVNDVELISQTSGQRRNCRKRDDYMMRGNRLFAKECGGVFKVDFFSRGM